MQLAILFERELADDTGAAGLYHDLASVRVDARFDPGCLAGALAAACARHDILRTSFDLAGFREPMQLVHASATVPVTVDTAWRPGQPAPEAAGDPARLLRDWWERERSVPFDLARPPLVRCHVLRSAAESFQLSLVVHHIILDGWSLARLMTEVVLEYDRRIRGVSEPPRPAPATRFRDFVAAEQASAGPSARRFWDTVSQSRSPAVLPELPAAGLSGEFAFSTVLPAPLDTGLRRLAHQWGVPLKSVFFAAHLWAVAALTGCPDATSGLQVNGRLEAAGAEEVLGLLLNVVPVNLSVRGGTWAELVATAFAAERDAQPFRRYPLATMQQAIGLDQRLIDVVFNYTDFHVFGDLDSAAGVRVGDWWFSDRHNLPLLVEVTRSPRGGARLLKVSVGAGSPLAGTGARLGEEVLTALRAIAADPQAPCPVPETASEAVAGPLRASSPS